MLPDSAAAATLSAGTPAALSGCGADSGCLPRRPFPACDTGESRQVVGPSGQTPEDAAAVAALLRLPFFLGLPLATVIAAAGGAPASSSRLASNAACHKQAGCNH